LGVPTGTFGLVEEVFFSEDALKDVRVPRRLGRMSNFADAFHGSGVFISTFNLKNAALSLRSEFKADAAIYHG
jgi:hypothetical protein